MPRGAVEHLKILRTSDPCYGSLGPAKGASCTTAAILSKRYEAMARLLKEPRSAKSFDTCRPSMRLTHATAR